MNVVWIMVIVANTIHLNRSLGDSVRRKIIFSDKLPAPLAFYSQAVQVDNVLYISGNLGMTVDGNLVEGVTNQTKLALDNIGLVLETAGISFSHVVKVTVVLSDMQDYGAMNDVYKLYFNEKSPARSAFTATLPRDAKVEIEAVAIVGQILDVEGYENDASRVAGALPILVLVHVSTIYRMLVSQQ